jgi:hypothetical protein
MNTLMCASAAGLFSTTLARPNALWALTLATSAHSIVVGTGFLVGSAAKLPSWRGSGATRRTVPANISSQKLKKRPATLANRRTPEQPSPRTAHRTSYLPPGGLRMPLSCHSQARAGQLPSRRSRGQSEGRVQKAPGRKRLIQVCNSLQLLDSWCKTEQKVIHLFAVP